LMRNAKYQIPKNKEITMIQMPARLA